MAYNSGMNSENVIFPRQLVLPAKQSFFVFGARGTGKSTFLAEQFSEETSFWVDLLKPVNEERFSLHPGDLEALVKELPDSITHIVIDEIQKIPKLLDVVHFLIEKTNKYFVMTGSSARKLKRGGANLLAGRAFVYHLFPLSYYELGAAFQLDEVLQRGALPKIFLYSDDNEKKQFLQAYTYTYLKEEIWAEHFINKLDPFRRFLEVAAQCNGKIINYRNIARDVGVDEKTVKEYFVILEDTLLGFFLEPFHHSFRKRLSLKPKFYFFDIGVTRALARLLSVPLKPGTSAYGETFEHFIILECFKLASYLQPEYRFSYLKTKDDAEVDLVVERPGQPVLFIEIKSSENVRPEDLSTFSRLVQDFGHCEAICLSRDPFRKRFDSITIMPWKEGLDWLFSL